MKELSALTLSALYWVLRHPILELFRLLSLVLVLSVGRFCFVLAFSAFHLRLEGAYRDCLQRLTGNLT